MGAVRKEAITGFYRELKKTNDSDFNAHVAGKWHDYQQKAVKNYPALSKVTPEDFMLLVSIARKADEDQFVDFVTTGQIPPIKLSKSELERLKGGEGVLATIATVAAICYVGYDLVSGFVDGFRRK